MQLLSPFFLTLSSYLFHYFALYVKTAPQTDAGLFDNAMEKTTARKTSQRAVAKTQTQSFTLLQLLILAALMIALARPALQTKVVASGSVIVMLDASASMNAVDVTPSVSRRRADPC